MSSEEKILPIDCQVGLFKHRSNPTGDHLLAIMSPVLNHFVCTLQTIEPATRVISFMFPVHIYHRA